MKTYKAFISQGNGAGCDYTIDCAKTVRTLKATSLQEAVMELHDLIKENYSHEERRLQIAEIYEIDHICPIDLQEAYRRIDNVEYETEQKEVENKEREEFERLKKKFG